MFFINYLHDTGPWSKKTSTLCTLLLLLAIFFVLEAAGKGEIVGLFKHKLLKGNKVELNKNYTFVSATSINSAEYKNISHGACDVHIKDDFIEITYRGEFCTVDLLSEHKDKIEFKTGVRSPTGGKIAGCLAEGREGSYSNVLPFIYSKNNEEINEFKTKGPAPGVCGDQTECETKSEGGKGECLKWTSLEVSWYKDRKGYYSVYTHLIGEAQGGTYLKDITTFDLEIMNSNEFKMGTKQHNASEDAYCAPTTDPIVKPVAWTITNHKHLSGDRLLVFSLLPPTVSRVFSKDDKITDKKGSGPTCILFIQFNTKDYRLLAAIAPPSTTTTTSTTIQTTTTTTTEAASPTTTSSTTTSKPEISKCPAVITTTCPECSKEVIWLVLFVIVFLALIGLAAAFVWFWMKKTKKEKEAETPEQLEDKLLRALYDDEAKKKGPDAVGPFDKWKDNRKKTEKGDAAQGLPPPDGKDASKNKPEEAKAKTEEKSKIEQSPTTKTAIGTDKSVVDNKGKSKAAGVDVKKATSAVSAQSAKTATPDVNTPSTSAIKEQSPNVVYIDRIVKEKVFVKSDEYTIEEYSYDDDGNLKPPKIVPENEISTDSASFEGTPELI
ncbi:hypothetical protein Mgra_00007357 [Meloidogyne graminicola]|uniref:Uncharacterized protein n=1 Tax=Meloidogyne graminicola TaxID=189291 RepID=A0A8S9ZIX7_9BILA|nr:hypothetical protein Mgra_00007357 [Meloidogyne graminicola]